MRNQAFCRMLLSLGHTISISCETAYMTHAFLNFLMQLKEVNKMKLVKIDEKKELKLGKPQVGASALSHRDHYFWD